MDVRDRVTRLARAAFPRPAKLRFRRRAKENTARATDTTTTPDRRCQYELFQLVTQIAVDAARPAAGEEN